MPVIANMTDWAGGQTMAAAAFRNAQSRLMIGEGNAPSDFRWPSAGKFNWALDWFDAELARGPNRDRLALKILGNGAEAISFAEMAVRSNRLANGLRARGVRRQDRILLMLGNTAPLWETMLAAMKLGAVVIPSTTMLTAEDVRAHSSCTCWARDLLRNRSG